jgi:glycosyltransferase involved in cell wall biosynthesis
MNIHKTKRVAVLKSGNPIKNQIGAENFCRERNLEYDLISAPNPSELLEKLSSYETLVYLPLVPESFCRLVVEAKMVGCKVITNKFVGATSESWFSGSREQIIDSVDSLQDEIVEFFNNKLLSENSSEKEEGTHFKIIVPFYNAEQWIKRCIKSIQEQNYDNFQCVIVDDCSTDSSHQVVIEAIGDDDRFTFVSNDKNVGALENIVNAIKLSQPGDEDVIVTLDGDDWFSHNMTLSLVNSYYTDNKCWLTYGSYYEYPSMQAGKFSRNEVSKSTILKKSFRNEEWQTSALRTFKYFLWKEIKDEDLRNTQGNYYEAAWDLAFMFPMLEMSGDKIQHIKELVYVYNLGTDINDHKVPEKRRKQLAYESEIRNKKKYNTYRTSTISTKYSDRYVVENPTDLLNKNRFDITAKTMYARHRDKQASDSWAAKVYDEHIKVWGNYTEKNPPKNGIEEFYQSFHDTLDSIKQSGFNEEESFIPVFEDGSPLNGSHRVAACINYNKPVVCKVSNISTGQYDCSQAYFSNKGDIVKGGLGKKYTDSMTIEYARNKSNIYVATLYQHCSRHLNQIFSIFSKNNVNIISSKRHCFSDRGKLNYVISLYGSERWIGNKNNNFPGAHHQARLSFSAGNNVVFLLLEGGSLEDVVRSKEQIRELIGVGKPSIHITDTYNEAWNNVTTSFSDSTLRMLDLATVGSFYDQKLVDFVNETKQVLEYNNIDKEDICVVGSSPLHVFGIRDSKDFDIFYNPVYDGVRFSKNVSSHNEYANLYGKSIKDIIYSPENHFYIHGIKMITLEGMIDMKNRRSEQKDINDVRMALTYLSGN